MGTPSSPNPASASPESGGQAPLANDIARILALSGVYFGTAKLSRVATFLNTNVSLFWPPAGIAMAALIVFGVRMWPGVFLGTFLLVSSPDMPWSTTLGISVGSTLEAVAGAYLLRRVTGFRPSLSRYRDVLALTGFAALLSSLLSAGIGTASLTLSGVTPWAISGSVFRAWWIGDVIGILVVTPVLLTWASGPRVGMAPRLLVEVGVFLGLLLTVGYVLFGGGFSIHIVQAPLAYMVFPFVIWAALRFGQRGATTTCLILSAIATWGTIMGRGPFMSETLNESLALAQSFMGIVTVTAMVLAAIMMERTEALTGLAELNAALDAKVADRTAALERAKAEVVRLMSIRAQEVSAAVHDLGHGLQSIQATLDVLFLDLQNAGVEAPLLETSMQQMQTSIEAQDALLNQMRDATLLENGQLVLRPGPTSVGVLVKKATEQVAARCRAEGLSLSFSLPEQELIAFCDPARIRRVLDNVLENALRYTRAFREDGGSIEVTIEHLKEMIECSVRDNGAGMSAEALASVGTRFTRFAEGDGAPEGTGQGLSFCKGIMELTGGEMLVTSPGRGKGTTVKLRLPRAGREKGQ